MRLLLLLLLVGSSRGKLAHESRQIEAFDCSNPSDIEAVSVEARPCKAPARAASQVNASYAVVQRARYRRITAWRCQQEASRSAYYCGHYDHETEVPQWGSVSAPRIVPVDTCKEWVKTKTFTTPKRETRSLQVGGTTIVGYEVVGRTAPWDASDLQCYGETYRVGPGRSKPDMVVYEHSRITVRQEELWIDDDNNIVVRNGNLRTSCKMQDLECDTTMGTLYWPVLTKEQQCQFHVTRFTTGVVASDGHGNRAYMSSDSSMVRLMLGEGVSLCGEQGMKTDFDRLFLVEKHRVGPLHKELPADEVSITTYVDTSDAFIYGYLSEFIQDQFKRMVDRQCRSEGQARDRAMRAMATAQGVRQDGRTSNDGAGHFFSFNGDAAYSFIYRPVMATGRDDSTCYDALPVDLLAEDLERYFTGHGLPVPHPTDETGRRLPVLFVEPGTHRLTSEGIQRPCSRSFPSLYENSLGGWVAVIQGELHLAPAPTSLADRDAKTTDPVTGEPRKFDFEAGGVYPPVLKTAYEVELQERTRREKNIVVKITDNTVYEAGASIRAHDVFAELPSVNLWELLGPFIDVLDHVGRGFVFIGIVYLVFRLLSWICGLSARCFTAATIFGLSPHLGLACCPSFLDCFLTRAGAGIRADNHAQQEDAEAASAAQPPTPAGPAAVETDGRAPDVSASDRNRGDESPIAWSEDGDQACLQAARSFEGLGRARLARSTSYQRLRAMVRTEFGRLRRLNPRDRVRRARRGSGEEQIGLTDRM